MCLEDEGVVVVLPLRVKWGGGYPAPMTFVKNTIPDQGIFRFASALHIRIAICYNCSV
jgi:hypothetical protein